MKPGLFVGAAGLALMACQPAAAQYDRLVPPSQRLPAPPVAKPLTAQEKAAIQQQSQQARQEPGEPRSYTRIKESREGSQGVMPGLERFATDAKGYSGQPTRPGEPIDITLVSPAHEQSMATSRVQLVLDVQNFVMAPGGNRLHVILDGGSPMEYVTAKDPLILNGLSPGGHTLRIYAVGPDGRMLKTPGSYLVRHFFVRRRDVNNYVSPEQPYITVNLPPEGPVEIPSDGKVWFDFHVHNAQLAKEGGYTVEYRINGLNNVLDRDQGVFWSNLQPGKYELEVRLKDKDGKTVPGIFGGARRTFFLQEPRGDGPPPTVTPAPSVVFDQVPGYDPKPLSVATSAEATYTPPAGTGSVNQWPGAQPSAQPAGADIPTAPKEPQRVIRSAPAVTEEEAKKKDEGVIDLDAN